MTSVLLRSSWQTPATKVLGSECMYWHLSPKRQRPAALALHGILLLFSAMFFFSSADSSGADPVSPTWLYGHRSPLSQVPFWYLKQGWVFA